MTEGIWWVKQPRQTAFAEIGFRPWERKDEDQPVIVEWMPGSNLVGDFAWFGESSPIIRSEALEELASCFVGTQVLPVEYWQDPKMQRPKDPTRGKLRVWLPYPGPEMICPWKYPQVGIDVEASTFGKMYTNEAGRQSGKLLGRQEKQTATATSGTGFCYFVRHVRRKPGEGLIVPRANHPGDIFFGHEFGGGLYCDDAVRTRVLELGLTNVDFMETGEFA